MYRELDVYCVILCLSGHALEIHPQTVWPLVLVLVLLEGRALAPQLLPPWHLLVHVAHERALVNDMAHFYGCAPMYLAANPAYYIKVNQLGSKYLYLDWP